MWPVDSEGPCPQERGAGHANVRDSFHETTSEAQPVTEGRKSLAGNRVLWVVVALFAVSFLVRGAYLMASTGVDAPLSGDEPDYHGIAASFLRGDGWTDPAGNLSYRPPLLPFQLLLLYGVAGLDPVAARWQWITGPSRPRAMANS